MTKITTINIKTGITTTESLSDAEIAATTAYLEEKAKTDYIRKRSGIGTSGYLSVGEQLDQLYRDVNAGKFGADAKTGEWFVGISSVKTAFPKP